MEMRKWHCWFMEFYYISVKTHSKIWFHEFSVIWKMSTICTFFLSCITKWIETSWNLWCYYLIAICKSKVYYTNYLHICSLCHSWLEIDFLIFHGQCWKRTVTTTVVQLTLCLILTNFSPFGTRASSEKTCVNWRTPVFE